MVSSQTSLDLYGGSVSSLMPSIVNTLQSLSKEDRDRYDELKKAGLSKYSREVTKKKPPVKRKVC